MSPLPSIDRIRAAFGACAIALLMVAGCGGDGGVDSGGTGASPQSFASGPITGFGSVIVAGVHFDESRAQVQDADGNARLASDLQLGMTVEVRGGAIAPDADGNDAAAATSVVIGSAVLGPVSASDTAAHTLTVLGQSVQVTDGTVFDASIAAGQAALAIGDVVEVYGTFVAASGQMVATRIERKTGTTFFAVRGAVSSLDTVAHTFAIGGTHVVYAAVATPPAFANGNVVRVVVSTVPLPGPVWTAVRIGGGVPVLDDRPEAKVEGVVSAFTSSTQFSVNGTPVDASRAQFPNGTAGFGPGAIVKVEGATANGVLVATQVELESGNAPGGGDFDVRGAITAIDTVAQTFVVRNVRVAYGGNVDFRKGTAADLAIGRLVEARGRLSPDGTRLQAVRIDFRD